MEPSEVERVETVDEDDVAEVISSEFTTCNRVEIVAFEKAPIETSNKKTKDPTDERANVVKDGEVVDVVVEYITKAMDNEELGSENEMDEESISLGDGLKDPDYDENQDWENLERQAKVDGIERVYA